jgi:transposase
MDEQDIGARCGHRDGPAQAHGHDRGDGRRRDHRRRWPVRPPTRRLHRDARRTPGGGRSRVWAIEGCQGIGRHIANRLLADGEQVVDVPAKLSARARVFATGQGRKTDATDAHSIALVGTRMAGLRPVVNDEQLALLRILVDRRRSLGEDHTRMVSQLHQLLLELVPGGAKKDLSAAQAKASWPRSDPATSVGKTRRRVAAELVSRPGDGSTAARRKRQGAQGAGRRHRHQPAGPARHRTLRRRPAAGRGRRHHPVPEPGHFASWNGTAPIDASSGDQVRHRLSRAGNRQINRVLHIMATVQLRNPTEGRAYYDRKKAGREDTDGSHALPETTPVRHRLPDHAQRHPHHATGRAREDTGERLTDSSATGSHPHTGSSDQSLPGPATTPRTPLPTAS